MIGAPDLPAVGGIAEMTADVALDRQQFVAGDLPAALVPGAYGRARFYMAWRDSFLVF